MAVEPTRPGAATSAVQAEDGEQLCPRCRTANAEHYNFCWACGTHLNALATGIAFRDPLIGAVVADRFRLLAKIGIGGMGSVYKVEHTRMGKVMALKLLHGDLTRDETIVRRFSREARAISKLRGRHTVQVFDFGHSDGLFFIVMEYLQGRDLGDLLIERERLSAVRTAQIIHEVCVGLTEVHGHSIVHRDLKPENIFVCAGTDQEDEHIKLLDFGLAKLQKRDDSMIRTQQGLILGTPYYMSPEQIDGEDVGFSTDMYSLGAVTYKILTGDPPYPGTNPLRVLNAHIENPVPRLSDRCPELAYLDEFFFRALAKSPRERFLDPETFTRTLTDLVNTGEPEQRAVSSDTLDQLPAIAVELAQAKQVEVEPDESELLPRIRRADAELFATAGDFDQFEWRLKVWRAFLVLAAVAAVGGLIWFVVWGVFLGNLFRSDIESEPNDTLKEANELLVGETIRGSIGEPPSDNVRADQDVFRIADTKPGEMLTVTLTGVPELDLLLDVVTGDGHLLLSQNGAGESEGEVAPNIPVGDLDLYVMVREMWREGEKAKARPDQLYSLSVVSRSPLSGEEREPNDLHVDASPVETLANGFIASADDIDIYRLERMSGLVTLDIVLTGIPRTDLRLEVHDATGVVIGWADEHGLAEGEHVSIAVDSGQVNQPLHARVSSGRGANSDVAYQLQVQVQTPVFAPSDTPVDNPTPD